MGTRPHSGPSTAKPGVPAPSDSALVIFVKAPIPGQVKTRLCPPLTPDEAASLHGSFVLDMLERSRGLTALHRFLACAPDPDHVFFKVLEERHGVRLIPQIGADLGARMAQACTDVFARGYRRVVIVGTDLPTLPSSTVGDALTLLSTHDLVLGPALDGGYYLIGLKQPASQLFSDIPWSTDRVLAATQTKAASLGLKAALLPTRRDIDTLADLQALMQESRASDQKNRTGLLSPRTAGVLRLLADRLPDRT